MTMKTTQPIDVQRRVTWWVPVSHDTPDADATVLVALEGDSEPVWLGYHADGQWLDACTGGAFEGRVTHWALLPEHPNLHARMPADTREAA